MTSRVRPVLVRACALCLACAVLVPAAGCGRRVPPPTQDVSAETTETSVFYSSGRTLFEEAKVVDASDVYLSTVRALLEAKPEANEEMAVVQPVAGVRSVVLRDGVATVDWDRRVLAFDATDQEKTLAYASVLMTLGQFPEVRSVRFTVEGTTTGSIDGRDVQRFWGRITLKGQPWPALRPPKKADEATAAAETTGS